MVKKDEEVSIYQLENFFKPYNLYLHFKGKLVMKCGESIDSETGKTQFLYREFNPDTENFDTTIWNRDMGMFLEKVPFSDQLRFKPISYGEAARLMYPVVNSSYLINKKKHENL